RGQKDRGKEYRSDAAFRLLTIAAVLVPCPMSHVPCPMSPVPCPLFLSFVQVQGVARTLQSEVPRMQLSALRALEFDRIVEAVKPRPLPPMGAERLTRLQPSADPRHVAHLLAATTETTRYIGAHGLFPLRASGDLPHILAALAIEGRALEAPRLLMLATFL